MKFCRDLFGIAMCGHERKQKDFRHAIFFEGCLHMVCMWGGGSLGVFRAHFLRTIQYFLIKFWTDFPGITRMVTILKIPRHALSLRGRFGYVNLFFENHSIFSHKILLRWDVLVFGTFWLSQSQCQKSFRRCVCFLLPGITILGYFGGYISLFLE